MVRIVEEVVPTFPAALPFGSELVWTH
jgi:hypothetical protein